MDFRLPILLIFCAQLVIAEENSLESNDTSTTLQQVPNPNILTIDLRQCFCSVKEACDLTIIKSSLREANCNDEEHLCCPMIKSQVGSPLEEPTENDAPPETKPQSQNNVRIYSINPTSASLSNELTQSKPKLKKNCSCKSRGTCPHKYIDYGFGFHCSYSTVRCCLPEEDPIVESDKATEDLNNSTSATAPSSTSSSENLENSGKNETEISDSEKLEMPAVEVVDNSNTNTETTENESNTDAIILENLSPDEIKIDIVTTNDSQKPEGELLITEVTNWSEEDPFEKDSECFCLSIERCMATTKYDLNSIERRRDTLCPGDLIQCCGKDVVEEITKKKDDSSELETTEIKQDFPPYQQPIQLPADKLPTPVETDDAKLQPVKEATLPPPQLPTQYHSYEPVSYNRGNVYTPNSYQPQLSGPLPYQKNTYGQNGQLNGQNIRPWVNLASPSSYSKYNPTVLRNQYHQGYPRGPYPDDGSSRSSKPGGLFDTLAQMLG